jgi:hypothetical protein
MSVIASFNRVFPNNPILDGEFDGLASRETLAKLHDMTTEELSEAKAVQKKRQKLTEQADARLERDAALSQHAERIESERPQVESDQYYWDMLAIMLRLEDSETPDIVQVG